MNRLKNLRYLYGPVPSRRLGRSLGVDLVPHKICTYDCVYCQIGKTTQKTWVRKEYIPAEEVLGEVKAFLRDQGISADYLSLGGSGEPTLHSRIRSVIEGIKKMTSTPVAVITNGSLLYDEEVQQDLLRADVVLPSMDAVSPDVFSKINRPQESFSAEKVIRGLIDFRKIYQGQIWLEILFCKGLNDGRDELQKMKEAVEEIHPDLIHLNTVVRPPSEGWAGPLNQEELEEIKVFFGERASVITEFDRHLTSVPQDDLREEILTILKRRPLSSTDLSRRMGIPAGELDPSIISLVNEGRIRVRLLGDSVYYEVPREGEAVLS